MSAPVLVRDLHKRYGGVAAVRGVGFEIRPGEIFGIIGPNGAGKTTTIECVLGLREPDEGEIHVCGIDARRHPAEVKERIGAALQTNALQDKITPREALDLFGAFYRKRLGTTALLDRFALTDKADVTFDTLSGGQRQRLALALAFVNAPELVFLDEPTAGLDAHSRRELRDEIAKMKQDGHTVLFTTHDIADVEALCDRLAVIDKGRIIATGTPGEIIAESRNVTTIALEARQPLDHASLAELPGIREVSGEGSRASFRTEHVTKTLGELTRWLDTHRVDVTSLHVEKASLEDVFVELTADAAERPERSDRPSEREGSRP